MKHTVPVIKDLEYIIIDKTVTRNIKAYEDIIFDEDDIQPQYSTDEASIKKNEMITKEKIGMELTN
jgi:hypothetical protein